MVNAPSVYLGNKYFFPIFSSSVQAGEMKQLNSHLAVKAE